MVRHARRLSPTRCPLPTGVAVSPELRTRQTAEALQLKAIALSMLHECDYGDWRGSSFDEVTARDPDGVSRWLRDPAATPHGGESLLSLMQRVAEWLEGENARNHRAIVVTYATIIRAAIIHAIDAGPKSFWRIDIAPLSITRLSGANGRWNLDVDGRRRHVEDLPRLLSSIWLVI